jgi:hypothetical protein
MDVGLMMIFASYGWEGMSDRQVWDEDIRLARQACSAIEGFMKAAVWGTSDRVRRELEARRQLIGDFEPNASFRVGGLPYEKADASLNLLAKEVLPVLKTWHVPAVANAAE